MSERTDIVNIALGILGVDPITDIQDDSTPAELALINYDIARDATLEAHHWTFAIKRWEIAQDATAPEWGYQYRYGVPSDCLRVINVGPNISATQEYEQDDWELESGFILSNQSTCYMRGIRRVTDEGIYSNLYAHAFAAKMAVLMALPLTHSRKIMELAAALYDTMISEAASRDGMQGRTRRVRHRRTHKSRVAFPRGTGITGTS